MGPLRPDRAAFRALARTANLIPVYREILGDLETPVSAFLKLRRGGKSFLLESVEGGEKWARYSFVGFSPPVEYRAWGDGRVEILRRGRSEVRTGVTDPLGPLEEILDRIRPAVVEGLPRFCGGAVGFVAYDAVRSFERLPNRLEDDLGLPVAAFLVTTDLLVFDNALHRIKLVAGAEIEPGEDPDRAYDRAALRVERMARILARPLRSPPARRRPVPRFRSNLSWPRFRSAVRKALDHIRAGDVIQVVLSQRFHARCAADPADVYRALRALNPSPYMFYLDLGEATLIGSSPEVLVRLDGGRIEVRPIAGTRPRGATEEEDLRLARELKADPKERAEHLMLVDLGRNDVGRVARSGSVRVTDLMVVERYSHVQHLVSEVIGTLASGRNAFDVFRACFPAGTVSGAPKIRAMQIIEELEAVRRGPYAGSVGYFGFNGNMDMGITIRTLVRKGTDLYLQAGMGIVADSDPRLEFEESKSKARGMMEAVRTAARGLGHD